MIDLPMTTAEDVARERIEAELEHLSYCLCGSPMSITVRGDVLWVECESLRSRTGLRLGLAAGFHDRRRLELPEGVLAAA